MDSLKNEVWKRFTGTSADFEVVWEYLRETNRIDSFAGDPVNEALLEAEEILALLRKAAPEHHPEPLRRRERSAEQVVEVEVDEHTRERQETFSEVAAAQAATDPLVEWFRESELGGRLLSDEEANRLVWADEEVIPGLDMSVLEDIVKELAGYYWWSESAAMWFVLTGVPPRVNFISAKVFRKRGRDPHHPNTARITLTIDPSVDARDVEKVYRKAQRQLLKGDNRKLAARTLEAARFVAREIKERGAESWQRRTERWNRELPQWRYTSRGGLRQAFEKFWHPDYGRGEWRFYEPPDQHALHELLTEEDRAVLAAASELED